MISSRLSKRALHVGVVGCGKMGGAIANNLAEAGHTLSIFDLDSSATRALADANSALSVASSPNEVAKSCSTVITMLPNDKILNAVCVDQDFVRTLAESHETSLHISCSTISPHTSRSLSALHQSFSPGSKYVASPVFARPDGLALKQASFPMSSACLAALEEATALMSPSNGKVFKFGEDTLDPGAGNVTKICGNFLIAAAIESMAETFALAEANGVDRVAVKDMLTSTIFDCLIYKGYGQRVSERDHAPGGFALELGLKDVTLALDTAHAAHVPMPFGSVMKDNFTQAMAKGRENMDWSAVALQASESAGVDVSESVAESCKGMQKEHRPASVMSGRRAFSTTAREVEGVDEIEEIVVEEHLNMLRGLLEEKKEEVFVESLGGKAVYDGHMHLGKTAGRSFSSAARKRDYIDGIEEIEEIVVVEHLDMLKGILRKEELEDKAGEELEDHLRFL